MKICERTLTTYTIVSLPQSQGMGSAISYCAGAHNRKRAQQRKVASCTSSTSQFSSRRVGEINAHSSWSKGRSQKSGYQLQRQYSKQASSGTNVSRTSLGQHSVKTDDDRTSLGGQHSMKTDGSRRSMSFKQLPGVMMKHVLQNNDCFLVEHYLPPFCLLDPTLSQEVGELTRSTWDSIVNGDAQGFRAMKEAHPQISSLTYFYDRFYSQLFYLYPEVRPFFQSSITHQGRRLVKSMMGLASMVCYEKDRVDKKLVWLAHKHNEAGIHPQYYGGWMWNMLMTLRHCLGTDWTPDVEEAWVISASYMLRVILPVVVQGTKHFASPYTTPKHHPPSVFSYDVSPTSAGESSSQTGRHRRPSCQLGGTSDLATIPDDNPLNGFQMPDASEYKDDPEEERCKLLETPFLPGCATPTTAPTWSRCSTPSSCPGPRSSIYSVERPEVQQRPRGRRGFFADEKIATKEEEQKSCTSRTPPIPHDEEVAGGVKDKKRAAAKLNSG
eukprot:CAMPEP_0194670686 /NCGR_PEP_ID=MMETSP0295-20121207/5356_1 /TAXON_ID=39354 /ORGANISM="Heterosigma akashiwo, Strain CCMP2393" /LENGTH=496 /DNA_ID=CAMNT_0039553969 /DNA_START=138 /DNA_END=1624 /DNA_ORIENTATION=+